MLSEKDTAFLHYWEKNRETESTTASKIIRGFPMALMFGLPIILLLIVVRLFLPEWYMKIAGTSPGMFFTAVAAMLIVVVFYAFFRMQYKWEMNDQLYQELKAKEKRSQN